MFGDVGHGILMMLSAATLILLEKKFKRGTGNEVSISLKMYVLMCMVLIALLLLDLRYLLLRSIHHILDGSLRYLHWINVQRHLLALAQSCSFALQVAHYFQRRRCR